MAGWTVGVGTAAREGIATASRWCTRWHEIRSPVQNLDAFVADVNRAVRERGYEVLFASGDAEVMAISYARAAFCARVPYAPHHLLRRAFDKLDLVRAAEAVGVPVPRTVEANDAALVSFTNGLVVKSRLHWEPGRSGDSGRIEAQITHEYDAARRYADAIRTAGAEPVYQEFKRGQLMGFTVLTDDNADVVAQLQQMAPCTWWPGVPTRAHTIAIDERLSEGIARLLKRLRWLGLVQLQFIVTPDGRPYLIDFNGRAYMSEALAFAAGLNLHDTWGRMATGRDWRRPGAAAVGLRYQWLDGDLRRSLARRDMPLPFRLLGCIGYACGAAHPVWDLSDPRPFTEYRGCLSRLKTMSWRIGWMRPRRSRAATQSPLR